MQSFAKFDQRSRMQACKRENIRNWHGLLHTHMRNHGLGGSPNLLYNGRFQPIGEPKHLNRFWWNLA